METLEGIIKDEIREKGPMTFARFMELALYHPQLGYYGAGARIGKSGDFYTSPHMGPVFGRLMAEVCIRLMDALPGPGRAFVEMGAGEGRFARDFLEHLSRYHAGLAGALSYVIIERSPGMTERQKETLGDLAGRVSWHEELEGLPSPVTGVFFSNELVDALPFHRIREEDGYLREIYVSLSGERFTEKPGPISTPLIARHFNRLGINLPPGVTTEVSLKACEWLRSLSGRLGSGFVVTVDYGYPAYRYYAPERRSGTMMCHHRHTRHERPYVNIGAQDITAHAEFTSLALEGRDSGLTPLIYTDQTAFLTYALEILHHTMSAGGAEEEEFREAGMGAGPLVHPEWMGGAFKVLVQSRGVTDGGALAGVKNRLEELFMPGPSSSLMLA